MRAEFKVTDSTDEICFDDLTRGDDVIRIPLFQREYVWTKRQFERLVEDISIVDDAEGDTQFLGAVVAIEQSAGPGQLRHYEVVDGQQRLTTIYLLIAAAVSVAARNGHEDYAARLISTVLLVRQLPGTVTNTRLVPCSKDRKRFEDVWKFVMRSSEKLAPLLRDLPCPPPASAAYRDEAASKLFDQFRVACGYCEERYAQKKIEGLEKLVTILLTRLSFIFISLKDPSGAPRIFENLNNAGVRTTVANLARNEIFGRMSDDPGRAFRVFQNKWEPFQGRFGERFDEFFFPYGLTLDPNVKKATLFEQLRRRWAAERSPEAIIDSLDTAADWFLWVASDSTPPTGAPASITAGFKRLRALRAPSSTYPFLMQLGAAVLEGKLDKEEAAKTLAIIESFLVRRAVCGFEPTGLHAVFKGLWKETKGESAAVTKNIRGRSTVPWPETGEFGNAVETKDLYHRNIAIYMLTQYEISLGADRPDNTPQIEHVMPQTLSGEWKIDRRVHKKYVDTWANLVAVSPTLNQMLGNQSYEKKRKRYLKESMYASPRRVAQEFPVWDEAALQKRAAELAQWAVEHWPW